MDYSNDILVQVYRSPKGTFILAFELSKSIKRTDFDLQKFFTFFKKGIKKIFNFKILLGIGIVIRSKDRIFDLQIEFSSFNTLCLI